MNLTILKKVLHIETLHFRCNRENEIRVKVIWSWVEWCAGLKESSAGRSRKALLTGNRSIQEN